MLSENAMQWTLGGIQRSRCDQDRTGDRHGGKGRGRCSSELAAGQIAAL